MSRPSQAGLWSLALGGSLAVHGLIGTALYAMPRSDIARPPPTEITMAMPGAGSVSTTAPTVLAPVALSEAAPVASSPIEAVTAVEAAGTVAEPVEQVAAVTELQPADIAASPAQSDQITAVEDVQPADVALPRQEAIEETVPIVDQAALPAVPESAAAIALPDASASIAPAAADATEPLAEFSRDALAAVAEDEATTIAAGEAQPIEPEDEASSLQPRSDSIAAIAPATPNAAVSPPVEAIAPVGSVAAPADSVVAAQEILPITPDTVVSPATTVVDSRPAPASVPVASSTATVVVEAVPAAGVQPVAPTQGSVEAVALAPVAETQDDPPPGGRSGAAVPGEQVAMLVPQLPPGDKPAATGPVDLAKFLKGYEGGGDCLLALPTGSNSLEAFSAEPENAGALEADYRKGGGHAVEIELQTVSKAQCGTLSFSRSLPRYPNYPIKLELDRRTIGSGEALSGRVINLLKPNLYLFVVDDEGKAKLIEAINERNKTRISFNEPLTLTAGPVKTVQLLVAIASDDPLTSVITKPGVEAETFFAGLTDEIRSKNRSIHFGITSFVVR